MLCEINGYASAYHSVQQLRAQNSLESTDEERPEDIHEGGQMSKLRASYQVAACMNYELTQKA